MVGRTDASPLAGIATRMLAPLSYLAVAALMRMIALWAIVSMPQNRDEAGLLPLAILPLSAAIGMAVLVFLIMASGRAKRVELLASAFLSLFAAVGAFIYAIRGVGPFEPLPYVAFGLVFVYSLGLAVATSAARWPAMVPLALVVLAASILVLHELVQHHADSTLVSMFLWLPDLLLTSGGLVVFFLARELWSQRGQSVP